MGFKWSLVSIPDHVGVQNVGGRIGAAFGPRAFWESFSKMSANSPRLPPLKTQMSQHLTLHPVSSTIEENHASAAKLVREAASGADRTIIVGGGHDHGYSHLLGIRAHLGPEKRIGCINIDAHLDVRKPNPKTSSGSPFYLAIESKTIEGSDLVEFGIQTQCNAQELWEYANSKNVTIIGFDSCRQTNAAQIFKQSLEKLARLVDSIVVSLDLDSAAEAFAPGVSAPQSEGFSPSDLIEICEVAGASEKVLSLGIFELNPLHDLGSRTARLAATCAYRYLEKAQEFHRKN
jgi:formiminoglutamase